MRRLVCIVEGKGDARAVPVLCKRMLLELGKVGWHVDEDPIRYPRNRLVDHTSPSPGRPARSGHVEKALEMALRRRPNAVLMTCDADDDCAARWSASALGLARPRFTAVGAHMFVREFEAWLAIAHSPAEPTPQSIARLTGKRNAKAVLKHLLHGDYTPTIHQAALTQSMDLGRLRACDGYLRLLRVLERICPM
jgi:hypothetical protein